MKILVVMGSPRKGESYAITRKVEEYIQKAHAATGEGQVTFDYLWLKDANIGPCIGCHACIRFGEHKCPLKDDIPSIQQRMMDADGLILVSPVYSQQVTALMKAYIDHFSFLWHRPRFFGKFVMSVSTGGGQFTETLSYMTLNAKRWGYTSAGELGAPHPDSLVPKRRQALERNIEKASLRFHAAIRAGKVPGPSLFDLIWFRMWRLTAVASKKFTPKDFEYYTEKGWFEKDYYTGVSVGPIRHLFANGMEKLLQAFMRTVYQGY